MKGGKMEKNVKKTDRIIRFVIGLVALYLAYAYNVWWLIVAIIALATSLTGMCPVYSLFKKKSKPVAKKLTKKKK